VVPQDNLFRNGRIENLRIRRFVGKGANIAFYIAATKRMAQRKPSRVLRQAQHTQRYTSDSSRRTNSSLVLKAMTAGSPLVLIS
jgi:hypothetical protein